MKKLLSIILLLACLTMQATERLRIMTFNVPMGNIPAVGLNTWANRCIGIQNFIDSVRPDMMGMQEPVRTELMNLLSGMPGYSMLGVARDNGQESGEYSPILYLTDRLLVEHTGTYWLSKTPEVVSKSWSSACNRIATWALFRDKQTGARFIYTNTHLDHISDSAREHQMEVIKTKMTELRAQYGNLPMMLTGDFNVKRTGSAYQRASTYKIPMNDAYVIAKAKAGPSWTWCSGGTKIDYIFLTQEINCEKAYIHESRLLTGQQLSDHNAHYADISWETSLSENATALLEQAQAAYDSLLVPVRTQTKLITNATDGSAGCQLSCDKANETEGQYYRYLIDGNLDTYFHSQDKSPLPPNRPHYLQADLRTNDVTAFTFRYARRNNDNYGKADRWQDVMIVASDDRTNWDYITELYNFGGPEMIYYDSPAILLPRPYRYIRFSVMHTPAMKIRNGHPQFSCSEFQIFEDTISTQSSQRYYDAAVKGAADTLQAQMAIIKSAGTSVNQAQYDALAAALTRLRSVKIDRGPLSCKISEAEFLLTHFSVGTDHGQTTQDQISALDAAKQSAQAFLDTSALLTKAQLDQQYRILNEAVKQYRTSLVNLRPNRWIYIVNKAQSGKGLYAPTANADAAVACNSVTGGTERISGGQLASSMWRAIPLSSEDTTYALQNRETGMFLGQPNLSTGVFTQSIDTVAYKISLIGSREFVLYPFQSNLSQRKLVTASESSPVLTATQQVQYGGLGSWGLDYVADDADLSKVKIPVQKNSIRMMTLPFTVDHLAADNPDMKGYRIVRRVTSTSYNIKEQESFAAGEPFILIVGDWQQLGTSTDSICLKVTPPDVFVSKAQTVNGLTGLLNRTRVSRLCYYYVDNTFSSGSNIYLDGQTGYILRAQVKDTGETPDFTISLTAGITGISQLQVVGNENSPVDVYSADGRLLRRQVKTSEALCGLLKGIYIVGKRKVVIP